MENGKKELKKPIILILVALAGYWAINNFSTIGNMFSRLFDVILPFVLGGCLAFILNIPMTFFEKKLLRNRKKKKKSGKGLRILSIIFAVIVILLIASLVITLIVPELVEVVNLLIDNLSQYIDEISNVTSESGSISEIRNIIKESDIDIESVKEKLTTLIPSILTSSISVVGSIIDGFVTFFISIIFAIYILIDKEKLKKQVTKIIYAYIKKEKADKIINIGRVSKNTFKNFLTVQCFEATILGTLCMIGMLILRIPYAVPIGVLVGVTALIPVVGAFIGIIVGAILIVAVEPFKALTFIIFVFILQQIEGNLIYPKVVGSSIGLPGMWVLFAVTVGGSIGGIIGMLVGVPVATIIYTLLKNNVNKKIKGLDIKI